MVAILLAIYCNKLSDIVTSCHTFNQSMSRLNDKKNKSVEDTKGRTLASKVIWSLL